MASKAKSNKAKRIGASIAGQRLGAAPSAKAAPTDKGALRPLSARRTERVYKPRNSVALVITVLALSLGAVAAGAGVYGLLFGAPGSVSEKYAVALLVGGSLVVLVLSFFGKQVPSQLRVGDDGLGIEASKTEINRIRWREVTAVDVSPSGVRIDAGERSLVVPVGEHPQAAARFAAEARARIPKKVHGPADALPAPVGDDAEVLELDPPQIAGATCAKSGRAIVLEADARLCGRCGEIYHRATVPPACVSCSARLA